MGKRWHAVAAPQKRHGHCGECRDIPMVWEMWYYSFYFLICSCDPKGTLINLKSPCQRRGIAVECGRGLNDEGSSILESVLHDKSTYVIRSTTTSLTHWRRITHVWTNELCYIDLSDDPYPYQWCLIINWTATNISHAGLFVLSF